MEEKTIRVEEAVWAKLMHIKLVERKKSLNDVIAELLEEHTAITSPAQSMESPQEVATDA